MKTLLTSLSVAPPVSSPVNEACLITVSVARTKSSADSNSIWELWVLGGSLMVATLPSGLPVLKAGRQSEAEHQLLAVEAATPGSAANLPGRGKRPLHDLG